MFDQFKRLFRHSAVYAIGTVAQSAVAFLLIPLYTRYIVPANYGRLEIINTFGAILLMLVTFGFGSALMKTYFRDTCNKTERKKLVGTMFMFVLPVAYIILAILLFFSAQLSLWLLGGTEWSGLFQILLITTFFSLFMNLAFALLRVQERSKKYTALFLLRFLAVLGLNFYFIIWLELDIKGILLANLITFAIVAFSLIPDVIKSATFKFSSFFFKKLWIFGLPIIPASIAMWFMDLSDRYFIEFFRSADEVGIYSLGYKLGMLVNIMIVAPFQLAWPTLYFDVSRRNDAQRIYSKVLTYFTMAATFLALALGVLAPEILRILAGEAYWDAYKVVFLVAISYVFYGMHFVLAPGIHIKEKTKYYPLVVVIPAIANLILNYFIVPVYGMMGAAMTTVICFIGVIILTYFFANHWYPVKYNWKRIWGVWSIAVLIFIASMIVSHENVWVSTGTKLALLVSYLALLYLFGFLKIGEIKQFRKMFKK
ncbi:lipopolysaccharide biosynthesis protein [Patescibacteria group bacterium]